MRTIEKHLDANEQRILERILGRVRGFYNITTDYERKAIILRGVLEGEQFFLYISSNRRMKQLMDWLSKPH